MEGTKRRSKLAAACLVAVIAFITLIILLGGHGTLARAEPVADAPQTAQVTANQEVAVESTTPATGTVNETSPPAQNSTAAQENLTETTTPQTTAPQTTSQATKSQATSETAPVQQTNQQPTGVGEQSRGVNEPVTQTAPVTTTDSKQADQGAPAATTEKVVNQPNVTPAKDQTSGPVKDQSQPATTATSQASADEKASSIAKAPKQAKVAAAKAVTDEQTVVTNEQELNDALNNAPNDGTAHTISLGQSFATVEGIFIKQGQNITFINQGDPVQLNIGKQIRVEKGASVTFKGSQKDGISIVPAAADHKMIFTGEPINEQASAMYVAGTADLTNTTIKDFVIVTTEYSFHDGAVIVDGGNLTLNENAYIMNNQLQPEEGGGEIGAGGIVTDNGATVVMNDGSSVIRNVGGLGMSQTVGGINIRGGSHFIMNGGHVDDNIGLAGGGVIVGDMNGWYASYEFPNVATMVMNGGTVDGNISQDQAGGIYVFGNGDVTINGGSISGNQTGFLGTTPSPTASGAGIAVHVGYPGFDKKTAEEFGELNAAKLTINDAVIDGNHASAAGGGIYVNSNRVTINKAKITNNLADKHGGGIYVSIADFTLHLGNSLITKNEAIAGQDSYSNGTVLLAGSGGGIWFCPTGSAEIFVTDGTAIYDNKALTHGDEVLSEAKSIDQYTSLANRMLGGGGVKWYHDRDGQQETDSVTVQNVTEFIGLKNDATDAAKAIAAGLATVIITGNKAPRGGGIGANGSVIFGTKLDYDKTIKVNKEWQLTDSKVKQPDKVTLNLVLDYPTSPQNGQVVDSIELTAADNWTGAFEGLPTNIAYKVAETPVTGFTASNTDLKDLGNGIFEITFTNKAVDEKTPDKPVTPTDPVQPIPDKPTPPVKPVDPTPTPTTPVVIVDVPTTPIPVTPLTPRIDQPNTPTPGVRPENPVKPEGDKRTENPTTPTRDEEDAEIPTIDQKIDGPVTLSKANQPAGKNVRPGQTVKVAKIAEPSNEPSKNDPQQTLPQTGDQQATMSVLLGILLLLVTLGGAGFIKKRI